MKPPSRSSRIGVGAGAFSVAPNQPQAKSAATVAMTDMRQAFRESLRGSPSPNPLPQGERAFEPSDGNSVPSPLVGEGQGEGWPRTRCILRNTLLRISRHDHDAGAARVSVDAAVIHHLRVSRRLDEGTGDMRTGAEG